MYKLVVSDPKTRKTYQKEVSKRDSGLLGRKINDKFKGDFVGLPGYELQVTGGSDKQGFPMRSDVSGGARKRKLLSSGTGFHPRIKGERRRKSVCGNTISDQIAQINTKVVKHGTKKLDELFGKKEEKKKPEEAPKAEETKKEEVKQEAPKTEEKPAEKKKEESKPVEEKKSEDKEKPKVEETKKE